MFTTEESRLRLAIAHHRGATEGFTEGGLSAARLRLMIYHHRVATEGFTEESRRGLAGGTWCFTTELPRRVSQRNHGGGDQGRRLSKPSYRSYAQTYLLPPTTYHVLLPTTPYPSTPYPLLPFLLNLLRHLPLHDFAVVTPVGQQFLVGTYLRDLPLPQYNDVVEFQVAVDAVGDDEGVPCRASLKLVRMCCSLIV